MIVHKFEAYPASIGPSPMFLVTEILNELHDRKIVYENITNL